MQQLVEHALPIHTRQLRIADEHIRRPLPDLQQANHAVFSKMQVHGQLPGLDGALVSGSQFGVWFDDEQIELIAFRSTLAETLGQQIVNCGQWNPAVPPAVFQASRAPASTMFCTVPKETPRRCAACRVLRKSLRTMLCPM